VAVIAEAADALVVDGDTLRTWDPSPRPVRELERALGQRWPVRRAVDAIKVELDAVELLCPIRDGAVVGAIVPILRWLVSDTPVSADDDVTVGTRAELHACFDELRTRLVAVWGEVDDAGTHAEGDETFHHCRRRGATGTLTLTETVREPEVGVEILLWITAEPAPHFPPPWCV